MELDHERYVVIDPKLYRPAEVDALLGNPAKAKAKLGWVAKTDLEMLIKMIGRRRHGTCREGMAARRLIREAPTQNGRDVETAGETGDGVQSTLSDAALIRSMSQILLGKQALCH